MKKTLFILLILSVASVGFSQKQDTFASNKFLIWKPIFIAGEFKTEGVYEFQMRETQSYLDFPEISFLSAGLKIDSKSYLWHPNFLIFDIGGELNPETKNKKYQIFDDRSELGSKQRINFKATFFNGKNISFNAFTNYFNGRKNIENIAKVNLNNFTWGGGLVSKNKYLPFNIHYSRYKTKQEEFLYDRIFNRVGSNVHWRAAKSFSSRDGHQLTYNYIENSEEKDDLSLRNTKTHKIQLLDKYYFDKNKNYYFSSIINNLNQAGRVDYNLLTASEKIFLKLPKRFNFRAGYMFRYFEMDSAKTNQNDINLEVNHKLYESLNSRIFFKNSQIKDSYYDEKNMHAGIDVMYKKAIPYGTLFLTYKYKKLIHSTESNSQITYIYNEEHVLSDGSYELLERAYIDPVSIVVTDISGSITYQLNFDYVIYERDSYIEIQRVPGGQINNNSIVFVDYSATLPGDYSYDRDFNIFMAKLSFFKRAIEIYYTYTKADYSNLYQTDFINLDYLTQELYGISTNRKYLTAGIEYVDRRSVIFPHQLLHYYARSQIKLKRFLFVLDGSIKNYHLEKENTDQYFYNISGKTVVWFGSNSNISLDIGYVNQDGQKIYLDMFTSRLEYELKIRQLSFMCGVQYYHRYLYNDKLDLVRGYFKIVRKFNSR